jgi:hypothetical protein
MLSIVGYIATDADAQAPNVTLLAERRITRTVFEYEYRISLTNAGTTAFQGVTASVTSTWPYTTVMTPVLNFGVLPAATTVQSQNNLVLRHDRTVPFDWSKVVIDPLLGQTVSYSLPPTPQELIDALPKNPETGRPIVSAVPDATLEYDANLRDPVTAVGACTRWITGCVKTTGRPLDDCARSVPVCATTTPWLEQTCCPQSCGREYRDSRLQGRDPLTAFLETYFESGSCFPSFEGLRTLRQLTGN